MTLVKVNHKPIAHRHHHGHPLASFDRLFGDFWGSENHCEWSPRTDIVETDSDFQIVVELPGMEKKDISIKVEERMLMINGEIEKNEESEDRRIRRRERFSGSFNRRFRLPVGIEAEKIGAELVNGLLTVTLPKSEAAVGREIEVK